MRTKTALLLFLPALCAAGLQAAAGCGDDESEVARAQLSEGCLINSDCTSPLVCAFRRCHAQCKADRDCKQGQRCVTSTRPDRVCQLEDERNCAYNSECPGEQVCGVDGQCRDQCAADRDCIEGQLCVTGTCAREDELVDGRLPATNSEQTTGQPCSYTSECPMGLVCRDQICNYECIGDADCAPFKCNADRRCEVPDAGIIYCIPGHQEACGCGAGVESTQICKPDGSGYDQCDCPDAG
jgi:hypothetical protein